MKGAFTYEENFYTYQPHATSSYRSINATTHYKVCACAYELGTEGHSFTYKNGLYYCISCGYQTSDPGGGIV